MQKQTNNKTHEEVTQYQEGKEIIETDLRCSQVEINNRGL